MTKKESKRLSSPQVVKHFWKIFHLLPRSCLLQRLNISEDVMTSNCQTWIKRRQQVVLDLRPTCQRCQMAHAHWPAPPLFYTAAVFIYTPSSIQHFYTFTKCLDAVAACSRFVCTCWKTSPQQSDVWTPGRSDCKTDCFCCRKTIWMPRRPSADEGFCCEELPREAIN